MSLSSYDVHKLDHISFHELHTYIHTHTHTHPHTHLSEKTYAATCILLGSRWRHGIKYMAERRAGEIRRINVDL